MLLKGLCYVFTENIQTAIRHDTLKGKKGKKEKNPVYLNQDLVVFSDIKGKRLEFCF